ncbi:MAG: class I SAM-dependent methyltransferase [Tannerella sp.]|jgi:SAM-dependent methyltransferase|nr:class I SAM-dependent methyltransferase [Tannerella sp.]
MISDSRFFTLEDPHSSFFVYELSKSWWSRFYEYEWCKNFVESNDVILDAASGVFHPFKYFCVDKCKEVHAFDIDPDVVKDLQKIEPCPEEFKDKLDVLCKLQNKIHNQCCSINSLPYSNNFFDKVFCISVLEHLPDFRNSIGGLKFNGRGIWTAISDIGKKMILESIKEFGRVLKPGGKLIMTFDFPRINLDYMEEILKQNKFKFLGKFETKLPENAVFSDELKLYCFRIIVEKES